MMFKKLFQRFLQMKSKVCHSNVGVRGLIIHSAQVLLVRHTYGPDQWYTVGGAVEKDESPVYALKRELHEEVGITLTRAPKPIGFFYNPFSRDYVALYLCEHFTEEANKTDIVEIAEKHWFSLHDLPANISPATKRRIEEYLGQRENSGVW